MTSCPLPSDLTQKRCLPCEGGIPALKPEEAKRMMGAVPRWELKGNQIERELTFPDFAQALAFVNRVGEIAESEGHHPDLFIHQYKKVRITLWTHAVSGLTENDFIVAAKIDSLS